MAYGRGARYKGYNLDRQLQQASWLEWRDNRSYRGKPHDSSELDPQYWFISFELGFSLAPGGGPSLKWTCENLIKNNRAALVQLGFEAPPKTTYPLARRRRPTMAPDVPPREETLSQALASALLRYGLKRQ